jgi:hypothetical protein
MSTQQQDGFFDTAPTLCTETKVRNKHGGSGQVCNAERSCVNATSITALARRRCVVAMIVLPIVTSSCAARYEKGARFNYQDNVGFAKVSVVSVVPWSVIENSLSPGFTLTGDKALEQVALAGRTEDETISSAFNFAVEGNFSPSGGKPSLPGTGSGAQSSSGTARSTSASEASSPSPAVSAAVPAKGATPSATSLSALRKYQLAASLYQEVQLLNVYIKHIAQSQHATPYLVSLDVNLFTLSPKAEVNSLVVISFQWIKKGTFEWSPSIVPVISSEDIELNQHAKSVHNLLTVAAALAGASPTGFGGSLKTSEALDQLSKLAGKDVNSLELVSSVGRDAMVVRFGASYGVTTQYALYPQARRVHCLVLIPEEHVNELNEAASDQFYTGHLFALANTSFRYIDPRHPRLDQMASWINIEHDSTEIPVRSADDKLERNLKEFNEDTRRNIDKVTLRNLWSDYNQWNFSKFSKDLGCQPEIDCPYTPVAWAEMPRIALRTPWSFTRIDLPPPPSLKVSRIIAFDDGHKICVSLPSSSFTAESGCWSANPQLAEFTDLWLLPDSVPTTSPDLSAIHLEFRSLKTLKPKIPDSYELTMRYDRSCLDNTAGFTNVTVRVMKIISPPPKDGSRTNENAANSAAAAAAKAADEASADAAKKAAAAHKKLKDAIVALARANTAGKDVAAKSVVDANVAADIADAAAADASKTAAIKRRAFNNAAAKAKTNSATGAATTPKRTSYGCTAMMSDGGDA